MTAADRLRTLAAAYQDETGRDPSLMLWAADADHELDRLCAVLGDIDIKIVQALRARLDRITVEQP